MRKSFAAHPLEALLLAIAAVLLAFTIAQTVRVALDDQAQSEDLTFGATLDELSQLLGSGGRDQLARLDVRRLPFGKEALIVDSVELLADPAQEPGVATGGFIADQVSLYNDHAIRRAVAERTVAESARGRGIDPGPSVLRTVTDENGQRVLSDQPNPFVLTVRSPYAERGWRDVRTSDWQRSGGVLGLAGNVPLPSVVADRSRAYLNGRNCEMRNDGNRRLLYCSSAGASDVGRFFDIGFEVDGSVSPLGLRNAFTYRPRQLWRNGARMENFRSANVREGDVYDDRLLGPFVLSVSEHGTLAAPQWINGRQSFSNQRLGALSFFTAAGRFASNVQSAPLILAVDARLSAELEGEARRFLTAHLELRRISIVVIDARTGELRAVAEPARTADTEPLLAFEPLLIGSVVKPLVASAIVARRPELGNLAIRYGGDVIQNVAGLTLKSSFANASNGCSGTITFVDFIRCSSNQYAAELLVSSLRADGLQLSPDGLVPRAVIEDSSIGSGLAEAFDVDAFGGRTAGRNPALWRELYRDSTGTSPAAARRSLSPWEPRPWLILPQADGTPLDWLARYAFGGWENRWTLIGVAEGYARIATSREVRTTIFARPPTQPAVVPIHVDRAFRQVRGALRRVADDGTAPGLAATLAVDLPAGIAVLSKTGTLNEETDRFKALALALGVPATAQSSAALSCGLVAVSYFEFANPPGRPDRRLPAVHLEFARNGFASVLRQHWNRLSGCTQPGRGGNP